MTVALHVKKTGALFMLCASGKPTEEQRGENKNEKTEEKLRSTEGTKKRLAG